MLTRFERLSALITGPLAVALWIAGLVVGQGLTDKLPDRASDPQVLAWLHDNKNLVIVGGWLFMSGCIAFIWFAGVLRTRLAAAEGGAHTLSTIAYAGAVGAAIFGIGTQAELAAAINATDVTAPTAGVFHHLGDLFFVGAELTLIVPMLAVALLAFRTAVVPRWWGAASALIAVVLWIGPIGWAALIFATPLWVLGTTVILTRESSGRRTAAVVTA